MVRNKFRILLFAVFFGLFVILSVLACGRKGNRYDTNLLKNPSFEDYKGNLPKDWHMEVFHGIPGEKEVEYGIDTRLSHNGEVSFYFKADRDTRRWFALSQQVKVGDISHIRLKGAIRLENVTRRKEQYAQCNFLISFFDKDGHRFQEARFADKRTKLKIGSTNWMYENRTFRVPRNTGYITVYCILAMEGTAWFDDLSLEIPPEVPWNTSSTKNFNFHWLEEKPFPPGAIELEQRLFDYYCKRLDVASDQRIDYYLYPDTATIQSLLSLRGAFDVNWDEREIHTIQPNEDHVIIHLITDAYGKPTKSIVEGTVFYLQDNFRGHPLHPTAKALLAEEKLPLVQELTNYSTFAFLPMDVSMLSAGSFIAYIAETYGVDRLMELYEKASNINNYLAFNDKFEEVYGFSADEANVRWRQFLTRGVFASGDSTMAHPLSGVQPADYPIDESY